MSLLLFILFSGAKVYLCGYKWCVNKHNKKNPSITTMTDLGSCSLSKFNDVQHHMIAVTFSVRHKRCIPVLVILPFWEIHNFWQLKINNVLSNKQLTWALVWLITNSLLKCRCQLLMGKKEKKTEPMKNLQHNFCFGPIQTNSVRRGDAVNLGRAQIYNPQKRRWCKQNVRGFGDILEMRKRILDHV